METIVNKVAQSGLLTLNLEQFLPNEATYIAFDLAPMLFKGLLLKEKDFRAALLEHNWEVYKDKQVAVFCSTDAIIPMWAYMLLATYLSPVNATCFSGTVDLLKEKMLIDNIDKLDVSNYQDGRLVIKGCGDIPLPESAFLKITAKLLPVVKSLMYGEPCSTVPVYKRK